LVGAELARLEQRELDAEHLYEAAIHSAREHGFLECAIRHVANRTLLDASA
jgi:hypothetical protein